MPLQMKPLIVLDDRAPEACESAARCAARLVHGSPDAEVHLLIVLPPTPSEFLEFGSLEDMHAQQAALARHQGAHCQWMDTTFEAVRPVVARAREVLERSGIGSASISEHYEESVHTRQIAKDALEIAREIGCDVIVIGRALHSTRGHWMHTDPAEELVRHGDGITVCVAN